MTDPTRAEQIMEKIQHFPLGTTWEQAKEWGTSLIATALRAEGDRVCRAGAEIARAHHAAEAPDELLPQTIATALLASRGLT